MHTKSISCDKTQFIGYNTNQAEYIIMRELAFIIKFLSCIFQTVDAAPVWQQSILQDTWLLGGLMVWYLHFSGYESRQLRQEQEEYEDTAENGNCGQRGRKLEWIQVAVDLT